MQFVLMILRLVLGILFPSSKDGLRLAARPDGRVENVPHSVWDWLLGLCGTDDDRSSGGRAPSARGKRPAKDQKARGAKPQSTTAPARPRSDGT